MVKLVFRRNVRAVFPQSNNAYHNTIFMLSSCQRCIRGCRNALHKDAHFPHLSFSQGTKQCTETLCFFVFFSFFPGKQVWVEIPLCTASVTDRKAHSCILIWSFTEHIERTERPSSSLLKPMIHCAVIWYTITERSACVMGAFFLHQGPPDCWLPCGEFVQTYTLKSVFQSAHLNLRLRSRLKPDGSLLLCLSFSFLSNAASGHKAAPHPPSCVSEQSPSSVSYPSLNREVILSQASTLSCFHLSCLSSHVSSCTRPLFLLMPPSSPQLCTWPNHSSDTKSRSLYPPLSALALQLVRVTECSASAYSHWQLAWAGGGGEDAEGRQGKGGMRGGRDRQRDRPSSSPRRFPPALSEEVSVAPLWSRLHHAEVWSWESAFWPRFASPHWQERSQKLSSVQSLAHLSIPLLKTIKVNISSSPVRQWKVTFQNFCFFFFFFYWFGFSHPIFWLCFSLFHWNIECKYITL